MTPDTVHLLAQLIRHTRGIVTSVEKWAYRTPAGQVPIEVHQVVRFARAALNAAERELSAPRSDDRAAPESQRIVTDGDGRTPSGAFDRSCRT